jgi:hypothetical protein
VCAGEIAILPAALTVAPQFPGSEEAKGGEKPEHERGKSSQGESGESEDDEQDGEGGEKEVHGELIRVVVRWSDCASPVRSGSSRERERPGAR